MTYTDGLAWALEDCCQCGERFAEDEPIKVEECGDILHPGCVEDYDQNQAEAAWERHLSDYYGGDVPTMREQIVKDWQR